MPKVSIGDAELYYEEHGSGTPVMLVPGLNGVGAFWAKQIPALAKEFRVIVHDHRGTGQSTRQMIDYSVDQMAADLLKLMDALKIDAAHYVGHSTGGAMGLTVAEDHPNRLKGLVLSAAWAGADPYFSRCFAARREVLYELGWESYLRLSATFLWPGYWISAHERAMAAEEKKTAAAIGDPEIMLRRIDAIMRYDRRAKAGTVQAPTMIVVAADDMTTPPYLSEELARLIPGATLNVLPKGGHFAPIVEPDSYNAALAGFLKSVR